MTSKVKELKDLEKEIDNIVSIPTKDNDTQEYLSFLYRQRGKLLVLLQG